MEQRQLTFIISETSVHVAEVSRSKQTILRKSSFAFTSFREPDYKVALGQFLAELNWGEAPSEITLVWCTNKSFLVPTKVFQATALEELTTLMFGDQISKHHIDYNRLPEIEVVNLYEIPLWVKSFFVLRYPMIVIMHEHSAALRAVMQSANHRFKIKVALHENYISLLMLENNELLFSNQFEYQTASDIVYYLIYVLDQKGLSTKKGDLIFETYSEPLEAIISEVNTIISANQLIPTINKETKIASTYINQVLCV